MASTMVKSTSHPRPASRSSSAASTPTPNQHLASSVLGLQHASRPTITGLRARSSNEGSSIPASTINGGPASEMRKPSPERKRRSSAFYIRSDSRQTPVDAGYHASNRWSQSTGSSQRSSSQNRRSSFSKRLSGTIGTFSTFSSAGSYAPHPKAQAPRSPRGPRSTSSGTGISMPKSSPPLLPPIDSTSSLYHAVETAGSTQFMATQRMLSRSNDNTPEFEGGGGFEYFEEQQDSNSRRRSASKGKRLSRGSSSRNSTVPRHTDGGPNNSYRAPESVYSPRMSINGKQSERRHSVQQKDRMASERHSAGITEGDSSASDHRDVPDRSYRRRAPSQKALLSKALAKANHAVVLDGRQNIEGAILAYGDACHLLRQVMVRSSGEDDRRKLEAVRNTYKSRIQELQNADQSYQSSDNKALPDRPADRDSTQTEAVSVVTDEDTEEALEVGPLSAMTHDSGYSSLKYKTQQAEPFTMIPPRRQSLQAATRNFDSAPSNQQYPSHGRESHANLKYISPSHIIDTSSHLQTPIYEDYTPQPPSSREIQSSKTRRNVYEIVEERDEEEGDMTETTTADKMDDLRDKEQHTSWLNTINESTGSSESSVHSRRSSVGVRRKRIRAPSGATEAEFDAALDAAIETAYDDGFEPDDEEEDDLDSIQHTLYMAEQPDPISRARRNVEIAKEHVREAEREAAISQARERERLRILTTADMRNSFDDDYNDDDDDADEERMLEEMTRDFVLDDADYHVHAKSALPRQSDSSSFSGRTWGSIGSNPTSAGTSLSTVAELSAMPSLASQLKENPLPPPSYPPPSGALPPPPKLAGQSLQSQSSETTTRQDSLAVRNQSPGVRERRLSGMKAKQLVIETNSRSYGTSPEQARTQIPPMPAPLPPLIIANTSGAVPRLRKGNSDEQSPTVREMPLSATTLTSSRKGSFPPMGSDAGDIVYASTSKLTKMTSADSDNQTSSMPSSPARFGGKAPFGLRKNFSSSSLRSKAISMGNGDAADISPNASVSSMSSTPRINRLPSPAVPVLPTPLEASFLPRGQFTGGNYLFDNDIHSPLTPGSPNPNANNAPSALEPCPESNLLRPFWFLRTVYQTIAHPRGGYLTNRVFVPREIWRVKNIKLKSVEDKVSTCDLLTAALLKLAKVDTYNADAILEEMQFLESVMEQAQSNLAKKLGNEVGLQGAVILLKGTANGVDDNLTSTEAQTSASSAMNKSYLRSFQRKLRSKNSLGPGFNAANGITAVKIDGRESSTMKSLPMSQATNPRFPKRDVSQVQCMGPNPSYMGALARLCDAVQILDQIARQVEDPGLKHSSPTHTGLELCMRHAAEFFGFYICRFVLADLGLMLDKFIKRSSEWVLA